MWGFLTDIVCPNTCHNPVIEMNSPFQTFSIFKWSHHSQLYSTVSNMTPKWSYSLRNASSTCWNDLFSSKIHNNSILNPELNGIIRIRCQNGRSQSEMSPINALRSYSTLMNAQTEVVFPAILKASTKYYVCLDCWIKTHQQNNTCVKLDPWIVPRKNASNWLTLKTAHSWRVFKSFQMSVAGSQ